MMSISVETINAYISKASGLNQHRDYLGLSKISGCPIDVYNEFKNGIQISELAHRMCYAGYEQERMIFEMLNKIGIARLPADDHKEIQAPFDARLRGHIDYETHTGDLLEIKSVSTAKFDKVFKSGRSLTNHYIQVQLYMRYGPWKTAWIVYRCRETYEHFIVHLPYNERMANEYEAKAKRILKAIDGGYFPACECGRHKIEEKQP